MKTPAVTELRRGSPHYETGVILPPVAAVLPGAAPATATEPKR